MILEGSIRVDWKNNRCVVKCMKYSKSHRSKQNIQYASLKSRLRFHIGALSQDI